MTEFDFNVPGPVVLTFILYAGAFTAALCAVFGALAYAVVLWANYKWGRPR